MGFTKELFILFAASAFRKLSSIYVFSYFPFGFEGRIWDLIVSVPDHCLSFYFTTREDYFTHFERVNRKVGLKRRSREKTPDHPQADTYDRLGSNPLR